MIRPIQMIFLLFLLAALTGCAGIFGSLADPGNVIVIRDEGKIAADAPQYAASIRMGTFTDVREVDSPRRLGTSYSRVFGITGKDLLADREVTAIVAESLQKRLAMAGFRMLASNASEAQFQLAGTVKEFSIDVKERDYVNIVIEATLTEIASGKVIWSGVVAERMNRFAGASGNSKKDVADLLRSRLDVVSGKTVDSILAVLMATRPDLFNMAVGLKPVAGVTVLSNAVAGSAGPATGQAAEAYGTLEITSIPTRAKLYVDQVYFGLTPLRTELPTGVHELEVKREGYASAREKVSIRKQETTELELKLQR
ncbi:MAG: hypothetical protein Fur0040_08420 [Sideroxydans sp.]